MLVTALALVALAVIIAVLLFPDFLRALWSRAQTRQTAEARAMQMLGEILAPDEIDHLLSRGYLVVRSPSRPGRIYHVPRRRGLVQVYEGGELTERLCVGSVTYVPDGDLVLLHKLMIEASEDEYLRMANHFSPRPFTYPF
jgi:hypothetical protein